MLPRAVHQQRCDADTWRGAASQGGRGGGDCHGAGFDGDRGGAAWGGAVGDGGVAADADALAVGDAVADANARRLAVAEARHRGDGMALAQADVHHRADIGRQAVGRGRRLSQRGQAGGNVDRRRHPRPAATADAHHFGLRWRFGWRRGDAALPVERKRQAGGVAAARMFAEGEGEAVRFERRHVWLSLPLRGGSRPTLQLPCRPQLRLLRQRQRGGGFEVVVADGLVLPLWMASHDEVTPRWVEVGDEVVAVGQGACLLLQQQGLGVKDVDVADARATADGDDAVFRPCHVAAVIGDVVWL